VETGTFALNMGDVLVLCTDRLYEAMYPEDIARIASQDQNPAEIARELVAYAIQSDGSDNAIAQVIRVRFIETATAARTRIAAASYRAQTSSSRMGR
jgi:serine/threonine protein phosphatase PrpC